MFWYKDFWIIILIILLVVCILGKSKHIIVYKQKLITYIYTQKKASLTLFI